MDYANVNLKPPSLPGEVAAAKNALRSGACRSILVLFLLFSISRANGTDEATANHEYVTAVQRYVAEQAASADAESPQAPEGISPPNGRLESALASEVRSRPLFPEVSKPLIISGRGLLLTVLLILAVSLGFRKCITRLNVRLHLRLPIPSGADVLSSGISFAEDPSLVEFLRLLHAGPDASLQVVADGPEVMDPIQQFFDCAAAYIANLRSSFLRLSTAASDAARQKILYDLYHQVQFLRESARLPQLLPFQQLAFGLEGLLEQLSSRASNVTPSALCTAASALNLLEDFCTQSFRPSSTDDSVVRLLVVDNDAISQRAICLALSRAFEPADLASDGQAALALAANKAFDVIFLDVEMPNMDGFEACSKIHETELNRATPVVFVTRHSDFKSRAKSTAIGGQDLIGKPFLVFEITVKALTLVWRARLQKQEAESRSPTEQAPATEALAPTETASGTSTTPIPPVNPVSVAGTSGENLSETKPEQKESASKSCALNSSPPARNISLAAPSAIQSANCSSAVLPEPSTNDFAEAFFHRAITDLEQLRNHLHAAKKTDDSAKLQEFLGLVYVGVHSLASEVSRAELSAFVKIFSALEGLLKKLLEHPKFCNPSTLDAAGSALELARELCRTRSNPDLRRPTPRLLVVDDDPVACRALSGALQLNFGKPASAASGETALALAAATSFDLVFLDVRMPGMDGFETCSKLHETAANSLTPVVFVTSHDDKDSRSQAALSGGCGFIPKPILSSQITLVALIFILRNRIPKRIPSVNNASVSTPVYENSAA